MISCELTDKSPFAPKATRRVQLPEGKTSFTWSTETNTEFNLIGYTIQTYLKKHAQQWMILADDRNGTVTYGVGKEDNVLQTGSAAFVLDGQIGAYVADHEKDFHKIFSDKPIDGIIEKLQKAVREENPARKHYLQFFSSCTFDFHVRPQPKVTMDEVILPQRMLADILDNTLYHLEHIDGPNGVIFYGPPGTGKSLAAQAIAARAIDLGYCAGYVAGRIDFEDLDAMVSKFFSPGVLILEDIDTFTESRDDFQQKGFSDFLQFMSGLFERKQKTVVIATTNHLKFLDEAVAKRPVRFNRRYEFKQPDSEALGLMMKQFFPGISISDELIAKCKQHQFTGSHLAEIKRTCDILSAKSKQPTGAVLEEAVEIVGGEFLVQSGSFGF
jgi:hypothetical protein